VRELFGIVAGDETCSDTVRAPRCSGTALGKYLQQEEGGNIRDRIGTLTVDGEYTIMTLSLDILNGGTA
jgi:hypothetical protein